MPESLIKLWLLFDTFLLGLGGITFVLDDVEKWVVFIIFATMGIYRIRILHHSSRRKRLENEDLEATLKERKEKLNKRNNVPKK